MDVFYTYTYGTAGWITVQAVPLILVPKLIIGLLAQEAHYATGFTLVIIALMVLLFTGTVPISSSVLEPISLSDTDAKAPYAVPMLRVTSLFNIIGCIYCYVRYNNAGLTGFLLGATGYGIVASIGGWCIVFGGSDGKISKRTGRDKRMAGFPFKNVNEYDKRKDKKMG